MPYSVAARAARDDDEKAGVEELAVSPDEHPDVVLRARIITSSWDGLTVAEVAKRLSCHERMVRSWIHRFNTEGLAGLRIRRSPGRPRRLSDAERATIRAMARSGPPESTRGRRPAAGPGGFTGPGTWTLDGLTAALHEAGIAVERSQVRRIVLADGGGWPGTRPAPEDDPADTGRDGETEPP
ncbi:helix-turn-helix domain-containing protein [Actinoplanes sp. NPDC049596]|uniref:helix-turn-helix domain-containing protein n=1 Tax=unclassified Actinoplanes TaxID=2626549 RepID=UPI00343945D4